ncbi:hypothetical protein LY10_00641 [Planktotalea frisia]|uniref:Uncharacterized protein n=1 Tax=Planktotalea frisia TaxID=696762 RepID=A0A1L9P278_9RHOB|nr:hypothetical protein PFRI_01140 [Planktotalea frisia]PZX33390.1 hypothetical protein LY10_00641 [Planktotalea frisia]
MTCPKKKNDDVWEDTSPFFLSVTHQGGGVATLTQILVGSVFFGRANWEEIAAANINKTVSGGVGLLNSLNSYFVYADSYAMRRIAER